MTVAVAADVLLTSGIDVGSSAVKVAVMMCPAEGEAEILSLHAERFRRRDLKKVIDECYDVAVGEAGVNRSEIAYAATTGEGELVEFRRGHFYGMTTHSRGAIYFFLRGSAPGFSFSKNSPRPDTSWIWTSTAARL